MRNLEQGRHAEGFGQVRSEPTEGEIREKDIFLNLSIDIFHSAGI